MARGRCSVVRGGGAVSGDGGRARAVGGGG